MQARLAPQAERDLEDILLYTEQTWGAAQSLRYEDDLLQAMLKLTRFPNLGRSATHLGPDVRTPAVNQHLLVYYVSPGEVVITRIVHVRRGPSIDLEE